ncbi:hypothetical protein ABVK25_011599 [Lepraria finkii]|uniref:Nephrocystin 3-like N-terminal domain-containing protein n=1 Tax=Lepraria finkii TaxID=1340010 RepID=A0ABR4APS7_9LECA
MADTRDTPLGLLPLVPEDGGVGNTTVDVIAVHGMETQFPLTWIAYERDQEPRGRAINWLCDKDMLPRVIPQARIWAYNYNSKCYMANAQEVDIQGLGETFLRLLAAKSNELGRRPLFFIGSCFGGIVVTQALHAASQHGNQFVHILKSTAGVVFLGAPLRGTSIAKLTQWIAFLRGFYGKETSATLLKCLEENDAYLDSVIQGFAKLAILQPISVHCFYETRKTHFAQALLDKQIARLFGSVKESACLDGHGRQPLQDARHAMMNKFRGPQDTNFLIVSSCIREFVQNSQVTMNWTPDEIDCLRALSSPYREDKERNPQRVPGTCHWVLDHPKFLQWQEKVTDLLWVSADPGCGKSVQAKALVDERLVTFGNGPGSLCYFFFKDEDAKRQDISTAISAVLHQLFSQQPHLLKHATSQYARHGTNLSSMFHDLWDIFLEATSDPRANEVICIVDALDECYERGRQTLIEQLCYVPTLCKMRGCKVKFLVTSRPYLEIDSDFGRTINDLNSISLRGEYESETIAQEIDLVIDVQIPRVANSRRIPFSPKIQTALIKKLKSMSNRTYLWLHLILEIIRKSPESTESRLEKLVQKLPRNLAEAYERILDRVDDPEHKMQARRSLHIVLASASPLTIREMNIAFAIDESLEAGDSYERFDELDLPSEESFRDKLRSVCGLFVRIVDSKIFLLHLTARDFLVKELVNHRAESMSHAHWKHSFDLIMSNAILAKICMSYLMLEELNRALQFKNNTATRTKIHEEPACTIRVRDSETLVTHGSDAFLQYAARNWAQHFKHATARMSQTDLQAALELFNVQAPRFERWFSFSDGINAFDTGGTELTGLQAASWLGLSSVVDIYIQRKDEDLNYSDESGATALSYASARAHKSVVQSLLGSGRITINTEHGCRKNALAIACKGGNHEKLEVVKLLSLVDGINPNIRDERHRAPLHYAVSGNFCPIVEQLLKFKDIDVNVADEQQQTPLILAVKPPILASRKVQLDNVRALLAMKDIDVNAQDRHGCTALTYCAQSRNNAVARLLLSRNATAVNLRDYEHRYDPLLWSIQNDDIETTKLLLDYPSTDINILDENKKTYLQWSLMSGSRDMTELLLSHPDIDVNMIHDNRDTTLTYAVKTDKIAIATLLLRHPRIDVNIPDQHCSTALMEAAKLGHAQLVDLLLQNKSTDLVARNSSGETAFFLAIKMHHPEIAKTLITPGMPGTAVRNEKAYAEIHWAAQYGCKELFTLLYDEKQVDLEYEDARDDLAMLMAIGIGDINALKSLVDNRKAVDVKKNTYGETVLFCAVRWDNLEAVKLLLEKSDFDLNARNDEDVTVLFLAIEGGFLDICKVLIQNGADVFSTQNEGAFSALDKIILSDHADLLKYVLDNDYDIDASKRVNGETTLHAAVRHGSMQTVQLLLECGFDANAPNDNAETPLHEAVRCRNAVLARVLLNHGASVNLSTFSGDELNFRHVFEHDKDVLDSFWQAASFHTFLLSDQFEFFGGGALEDGLED